MPFTTILPTYARRRFGVWLAIGVIATAFYGGIAGRPRVVAGAPKAATPLSGAALAERLASTVSIKWSDVPLRRALTGLQDAYGLTLLLDRRIDPEQTIRYTASDRSLQEVLDDLAQASGAAMTQLESVVYLGPAAVATRLRTVAALDVAEVQKLSTVGKKAWTRRVACRWNELTEPRELLGRLAAEHKLRLEQIEQVPHDLWPSFTAGPLAIVDQVTLIAAQFDLLLVATDGGEGLKLAPWPAVVAIERSFDAHELRAEHLAQWATATPAATVEHRENRVIVRGLVEDLEQLVPQRPGRAYKARSKTAPARHQLVVRGMPLGKLLEELRARLGWEFVYDEATLNRAGVRLTDKVTIDVRDASDEMLLRALCEPLQLRFSRAGAKISLEPAEKTNPGTTRS